METENKKINWHFWLLIVMLFVWLFISVYFYVYFKKECSQSKENPFVYAAKKADAEICYCNLKNGAIINFNQTSAWQIIEHKPVSFEINISKFGEGG